MKQPSTSSQWKLPLCVPTFFPIFLFKLMTGSVKRVSPVSCCPGVTTIVLQLLELEMKNLFSISSKLWVRNPRNAALRVGPFRREKLHRPLRRNMSLEQKMSVCYKKNLKRINLPLFLFLSALAASRIQATTSVNPKPYISQTQFSKTLKTWVMGLTSLLPSLFSFSKMETVGKLFAELRFRVMWGSQQVEEHTPFSLQIFL